MSNQDLKCCLCDQEAINRDTYTGWKKVGDRKLSGAVCTECLSNFYKRYTKHCFLEVIDMVLEDPDILYSLDLKDENE